MKRIYENVFHVRVRYIISLMVMGLACLGFVFVSYQSNKTFALTSQIADLWAELDDELYEAAQHGLRISEQSNPQYQQAGIEALRQRAGRIEKVLAELEPLWQACRPSCKTRCERGWF